MRVAEPGPLRFAVLQPGARLHYAVPALLARAGMLARLYTDICADIGFVPVLERLWPARLRPKPVQRLLGRRLPPEIQSRNVRQCAGAALAEAMLKRLVPANAGAAWVDTTRCLMRKAERERFGGANGLYTVLINSDITLVRIAREQGLKVAHEVMVVPDIGLRLHEERTRVPGVEPQESIELIEAGRERDRIKYGLADLILVPSEIARRAVLALGAKPERVHLVPYGIGEEWLRIEASPVRGRVLFVGSVGLLKGVHYLAEATRLLHRRGVQCEVRVVGPVDPALAAHPAFHGPRFVGQMPRSEVRREFARADVFVLPTICDAFALVHLEALACGVPVITTPNSGSVVRDGVDGFVVPIRDAERLADRIERLVTDRGLRAEMSHNARDRAGEYTWPRYGERLIGALRELEP